MGDLLAWWVATDEHPLISSSIFHYEFEFIHPFADGNGRLGRLWQSLMLQRWNPFLIDVPIDSIVHQHQADYYRAIEESTDRSGASPFVEFMLDMVLAAIVIDQVTDQVTDQVMELLDAIGEGEIGALELMTRLAFKHRATFRKNYLDAALSGGWIERTQPDSPRSPTQKYRATSRGASARGQGQR